MVDVKKRNYSVRGLKCRERTRMQKTTKSTFKSPKKHVPRLTSLQTLLSSLFESPSECMFMQLISSPWSSSVWLKYPLTFSSLSSCSCPSFVFIPCISRKHFRYSSASPIFNHPIFTILQLQQFISMSCQESTCRGGVSCCKTDPSFGAYCLTQTFCNSSPPLWETIFIPVFLFVVTLGIAVVVYQRYRNIKPRSFSLGDFVEREVRLEPVDRYEHTKLKTITSFE